MYYMYIYNEIELNSYIHIYVWYFPDSLASAKTRWNYKIHPFNIINEKIQRCLLFNIYYRVTLFCHNSKLTSN